MVDPFATPNTAPPLFCRPQVGIKGYMVGAMDEPILAALAKRKIHTFSMSSGAQITLSAQIPA